MSMQQMRRDVCLTVVGSRNTGNRGVNPQGQFMLKDNPVVKKLVETGEERIGKLAQQLLANEKFVAALQKLISTSLAAKDTVEKSLRHGLAAMNLPTASDLQELRGTLEQLERRVSTLTEKVARMEEAAKQ